MECSNQHFNWWRTSAAYENTSKNPAQPHNAKTHCWNVQLCCNVCLTRAQTSPLAPCIFFLLTSVCRCVGVRVCLYCCIALVQLSPSRGSFSRARVFARARDSRLVKTTWVGWIQDQRNTHKHNNAKYIVFIVKAALYFHRDGVYGRKAPLNHATTCKQRSNSRFACQCASPCVASPLVKWFGSMRSLPPSQSLEYRCKYKGMVYRGLLCFQHIKYPLEIVESMNCM